MYTVNQYLSTSDKRCPNKCIHVSKDGIMCRERTGIIRDSTVRNSCYTGTELVDNKCYYPCFGGKCFKNGYVHNEDKTKCVYGDQIRYRLPAPAIIKCLDNEEKINGRCYKPCKPGYSEYGRYCLKACDMYKLGDEDLMYKLDINVLDKKELYSLLNELRMSVGLDDKFISNKDITQMKLNEIIPENMLPTLGIMDGKYDLKQLISIAKTRSVSKPVIDPIVKLDTVPIINTIPMDNDMNQQDKNIIPLTPIATNEDIIEAFNLTEDLDYFAIIIFIIASLLIYFFYMKKR